MCNETRLRYPGTRLPETFSLIGVVKHLLLKVVSRELDLTKQVPSNLHREWKELVVKMMLLFLELDLLATLCYLWVSMLFVQLTLRKCLRICFAPEPQAKLLQCPARKEKKSWS
jgi:hypothetical protein